MIDEQVFNRKKRDYGSPSVILGENRGLFDTINKPFPELWKLYKTLKSLDWDENEVDYSSCNADFKNCDQGTYDGMIKTLASQWAIDSMAAHSLISIMSPFITSSEGTAGWTKITENEVLHAATYSEIVRQSFDNPEEVLQDILSIQEAMDRMEAVASVISKASKASHEYALGLIPNDQELYNTVYMFIAAIYILERIQFMASFAVTFSICDTGLFVPFGKAVQKIAQDELEVHVQWGKAVLTAEHKTERGKIARETMAPKINELICEVVGAELDWSKFINLVGLTEDLLKDWVLFNAKDVYNFFNLESPYILPKKNPLKYMEKWLNMNLIQSAPQEEDVTSYKVGVLKRDDEDTIFDLGF